MPKELKDITNNVMGKIHQGQIKMRPRIFFIVGSFMTMVGLITSIITSVFLIALIRFTFRSQGIMAGYKLEQMFSNFPLWAPLVALFSLFIGIRLLRRYDFSYKKNFNLVVFWFILSIFLAGVFFDMSGLNDVWLKRGPMKEIMRQYFQGKNIQNNLNLISIKGN